MMSNKFLFVEHDDTVVQCNDHPRVGVLLGNEPLSPRKPRFPRLALIICLPQVFCEFIFDLLMAGNSNIYFSLEQRHKSVHGPLLQADAEPEGDALVAAAGQDTLADLGCVRPSCRLPLCNRYELRLDIGLKIF